MKYILSLIVVLTFLPAAYAQMGLNSPAGLAPRQDMEIYTRNGLLVQRKYHFTTADPNASINTISCATSPPDLTTQAGMLKDPGGDSNYPANLSCTQTISGSGSYSGFEVVFEDLDTEFDKDRVVITDEFSGTLAFSGNTLPAPFFLPGNFLTVRFESNSNGTVGRGFRLRWRAVFNETSPTSTLATAFGNAFQFDARKGALLSGNISLGVMPRAGIYSSALGNRNVASGSASTAMGERNLASGYVSTALGYLNVASGSLSTAMGSLVSTNGQAGAFMIGDSDPLGQGVTLGGFPDEFVARFLNGYYLMTSGNANPGTGFGGVRTGVQIGRGQNSWASISDSTKKERFQPINPTDLLRKIGGMKLTTWNYKGQREIRHYGPMAQDFYAAFGHDGLGQVGCDTLIYSHDFAGVTFAGVQALINENVQLKTELAQTQAKLNETAIKLEQADTRIDRTNARLDALEAVLVPRRRSNVATRK